MGDEKDRPNISISQSATDSENVTQIGYQEGDVTIDNSRTDSSVHIGGDVNATVANIGSGTMNVGDVVGGDKTENAPLDLESLFVLLQEWVQQQENRFDQRDAQELTEGLKEEIEKGEEADEEQVEGLLHRLRRMTPDIWDVVVTTFANPAAGFAKVIQKIAAKAKETG